MGMCAVGFMIYEGNAACNFGFLNMQQFEKAELQLAAYLNSMNPKNTFHRSRPKTRYFTLRRALFATICYYNEKVSRCQFADILPPAVQISLCHNYIYMKTHFFTVLTLITIALHGFAQEPEIFATKEGAIRGYDAVAYFKEGKPVKGFSQYEYEWRGATWRFASQQNLDSFRLDPVKFAPQYGGYCAYGLSENHKSPTSPEAFAVINKKLYLNYNLNVRKIWLPDTSMRIVKADSLWKIIK